jgi:hypothetical protein
LRTLELLLRCHRIVRVWVGLASRGRRPQDELDKIYDITKKELRETELAVVAREREMELLAENHRVEIKVYQQKARRQARGARGGGGGGGSARLCCPACGVSPYPLHPLCVACVVAQVKHLEYEHMLGMRKLATEEEGMMRGEEDTHLKRVGTGWGPWVLPRVCARARGCPQA